MPQISQKQRQNQPTSVKESKPFRERLRDRYAPSDFVRVINIDNESFGWQYFPIDGEESYFDSGGMQRIVTGRQSFDKAYENKTPGNEQSWILNPGETEVLLGANADLFIEGLYKQLIAKKVMGRSPNLEKTQAKNFNFSDGMIQEEYINKIFLGIERPMFESNNGSTASGIRKEKVRAGS